MKLLLSGFIASILIFSACEKVDDPITGPTELQKQNFNSNSTVTDRFDYEIIPLPPKGPGFIDSIFTVSKLINGLLGGNVILNKTYLTPQGKLVTMLVNVKIPALSFFGQRNIRLTIDNDKAAVHCEPGMTFNRPLIMLQTFIGLDLSNTNTQDIDFVYINDDGTIEDVPNSQIIVIKPLGLVTVISARLNHFSRYGWVR
ncbi:MAG: hypothetical protein ACHQLA_02960 [Ignavibacteriales bacterium]